LPSLDFDREQAIFRSDYDSGLPHFERIMTAAMARMREAIAEARIGEVAKIEGRIKDREECLRKFQRKYQSRLEAAEQPYEIRDYLSDLIGIRIVCLYDDQIPLLAALLKEHFRVLDVTDKISAVESTEDIFGYKGLHMDLAVDGSLQGGETSPGEPLRLEVQIRTLIQDAWSVLDHKIKYKKSIPSDLKRRINVLSALFELADREFKAIRDETIELMQEATGAPVVDQPEESGGAEPPATRGGGRVINVFSFLRIAGHFFRDFDFDDDKVDDFVQDILKLNAGFQKSELHRSLTENLKTVRDYRDDFMAANPHRSFSPYTMIRHCLYLYEREDFARILARGHQERFLAWLSAGPHADTEAHPRGQVREPSE